MNLSRARSGNPLSTISTPAAALVRTAAACLLGLAALNAAAEPAELRAKYTEVREQMRNNTLHRSLHIDSSESQDALQGDVYAVLDHPFEKVSSALANPAQWCDIMILPFNTKYCHAVQDGGSPGLLVRIGRKFDQPLHKAHRLRFSFRNLAAGPGYFESRLNAAEGPMGTRDYRMVLAAVPLDGGRTFIHLGYSYAAGMAGRIAMQSYLATLGADKVGFTVTGRDTAGQPQYIAGVRGAVERNAMRYYLAIDSYLDSLDVPAAQQVEKRIQGWFTATERYPRQLREMDRPTYVAMKRLEVVRQQALLQ